MNPKLYMRPAPESPRRLVLGFDLSCGGFSFREVEMPRPFKEGISPERMSHGRLSACIVNGRVQRGSCAICGRYPTHAHHEDYNKPLDVVWLCAHHHHQLHRNPDKIYEELSHD